MSKNFAKTLKQVNWTIFRSRLNLDPLNIHVLICIVLGSFILTIITTLSEFTVDLRQDISSVYSRLNQIHSTSSAGIENSLWMFDNHQLLAQLNGIRHYPDMVALEVIGDDGTKVQVGSYESENQGRLVFRSYPLLYQFNNKLKHLGTLNLVASLDRVYQNFIYKIFRFLIVNGLKTFPLSIFIIIVLRKLITRHLDHMAKYARSIHLGNLSTPLKLNRKDDPTRPIDKLDDITSAMNEMRESLLNGIAEVKKIEKQKLELLAHTQEMLQMRDDFISIASHELRTPVTAINLQLQLIVRERSRYENGTDLLGPLDLLCRQVERLKQLVETLVHSAVFESKAFELKFLRFNLSTFIIDIIDRISPFIKKESYQICLQIEDGIFGTFDQTRIEEVVINLITNAIKFGKNRPIDVILEKDQDFAKLTIRDYGIGIKKNDQTRIFGKYERGVSMRSFGGFGLGLYVSKQIVEAHGGEIKIESHIEGGTSVLILLPLNDTEPVHGLFTHEVN